VTSVTTTLGRWSAYTAAIIAIAAATVGLVHTVREFNATADRNSDLDYADREVAWGNGWTLSQEALYAARSLIPASAVYSVAVGPTDRFDDPLTPAFVASYLRAFLIPRPQRENANWVVCYRCDAPAGSDVVWTDEANGISILRRRPRT
jgi:hypothetical protein